MKIGIDSRVPPKNKTGIGHILDNILPYIVNFDKNIQYVLIGRDFGIKEKNVRIIKLPKTIQRGFNFLWRGLWFPSARILIGKTDCFFFTNFVDFPVNTKKRILMIPDLSYIKYPQYIEKKNLSFLTKKIGPAIKRSDKIITISENAKNEIIEHYDVSPDIVEVVYLGCPEDVNKVTDSDIIESIKNKYGINGKYIFFVGTLEPRKNIEGLIAAYNNLEDSLKKEYKLVICGSKGWYYDKIFSMIDEFNLKENIVFTGYTNAEEKSSLYSGASLFVFPSFYEGFGMPILEAYKCGVPVVTADNSSLVEIGGDAALYCQAENIESIRNAMKKLLSNRGLREEMVERGYNQLKLFSWEDSAKKILKILNN